MSNIKPGGVIANRDKFILLDVRTLDEYKSFHIDGSIHLPLDVLEKNIAKIPTHKPVVCMCRTGSRSETATYFLNAKGLEARNLEGGILAWVKTLADKKIISEREHKELIKKINDY